MTRSALALTLLAAIGLAAFIPAAITSIARVQTMESHRER